MFLLCSVLVFQLFSCGTILYPERQGQKQGALDIVVVLLDAAGLLFFVIPGVIAFALDFHTGAIYLPPDHPRSKNKRLIQTEQKELYVLKVDPKQLNVEGLSSILTKEMGFPVRLDDSNLMVKKPDGPVDIASELKRLSQFTAKAGFSPSLP
jgi:hypothetical protein